MRRLFRSDDPISPFSRTSMDLHKAPEARDRASHRELRERVRATIETRAGDAGHRASHDARVRDRLLALAGHDALFRVNGLSAGYGSKEVLHGVDLRLGAGQLLCVVGPSGAGKSTLLHSIFGLADIRSGQIEIGGRNVTRLGPNAKLRDAGIACVLRDSSLFPDMTVEQNLWLGGYLRGRHTDATRATEHVFDRYPFLAARRDEPARALGDGERRLVEISRALVMRPRLLLVDECSASLEPAELEAIHAMLCELRDSERLSVVMVESDAKRGLEVADIGCVLAAGEIAAVGTGAELLGDATLDRLFLSP